MSPIGELVLDEFSRTKLYGIITSILVLFHKNGIVSSCDFTAKLQPFPDFLECSRMSSIRIFSLSGFFVQIQIILLWFYRIGEILKS